MFKLVITFLTGICISISGYSQVLEGLKNSSGSHGSWGGSGGSVDIDPVCIMNGCDMMFDILSVMDFSRQNNRSKKSYTEPNELNRSDTLTDSSSVEKQKNELDEPQNYQSIPDNPPHDNYNPINKPFETMLISVRGSYYPTKYNVWIPEINGSKGNFSYAARMMIMSEQRLDKVDHYYTFDVQPIQINFVNHNNFLFKAGIGAMAETFSGNLYFECTSNLKWRPVQKIDIGLEGRMAIDYGIVRQEASLQVNYAVWQKNNKQFLVGLNGMLSEYYQAVDINTLGLSTGFRF